MNYIVMGYIGRILDLVDDCLVYIILMHGLLVDGWLDVPLANNDRVLGRHFLKVMLDARCKNQCHSHLPSTQRIL